MGDTGEDDASQYAVLPAVEAATEGTDFMVICSDVIYPAGGAEGYADKFSARPALTATDVSTPTGMPRNTVATTMRKLAKTSERRKLDCGYGLPWQH